MKTFIKELAVQAGLLHKQIGPSVETRYTKKKEQAIEKFAELVAKACASAIITHKDNADDKRIGPRDMFEEGYNGGAEEAAQLITYMFKSA